MINGNKVAATSTALQARVALFQPSQRPTLQKNKHFITSYGECSVTGRLGQRHADLLEALLFCAEKKREISDGGIELLVDPANVRKTLSDSRYSYEQIEKLLVELRTATITIRATNLDFPIIGGLLDHVIPSPMTRHDPLTGGERSLWRVRLGIALVMLLENDLALYYQPAPLARLRHGVSQAVARHVLTHKNTPVGGWHLNTLLKAVYGNQPTSKQLSNARTRIKDDYKRMEELGILIDKESRVKCI